MRAKTIIYPLSAAALAVVAGILPGCVGSGLAGGVSAVHAVTQSTSPSTPTALESALRPLVQAAGSAFPPWSEITLAVVAALSGWAGTIIQTIRHGSVSKSLAASRAALAEAGKSVATTNTLSAKTQNEIKKAEVS